MRHQSVIVFSLGDNKYTAHEIAWRLDGGEYRAVAWDKFNKLDGTEGDFHVIDMMLKKRRLVQAACSMRGRTTLAREAVALEKTRRNLRVAYIYAGAESGLVIPGHDSAIVPVWKVILKENNG